MRTFRLFALSVSVAVVGATWSAPSSAQLVGAAPCAISSPIFFLGCPFTPVAIQSPVFQNVYVFSPNTSNETWDEHLTAFLKANPENGPPTNSSPVVNCMNGTDAPCLQDLTSEAIDNLTRAIFSSSYFQPMQNSYGINPPQFAGDATPTLMSFCMNALGQNPTAFDLAAFITCAFPQLGSNTQLNLILAPEIPPPPNWVGSPTCSSDGNTTAYHFATIPVTGSTSGLQQCAEAALVPNPFGPIGALESCVNGQALLECAAEAQVGSTVAPVVCGIIDGLFGLPGLCESAATSFVATCVAESGVDSTAQELLSGLIAFTVIPTNPVCFNTNFSATRQIFGGGSGGTKPAAGAGAASPLDWVARSLSHEMVEAITDPSSIGWVDTSLPLGLLYNDGEIADLCSEIGSEDPGASGNPSEPTKEAGAYMPFKFWHLSRYWSNADNKCMPNFQTTELTYSFARVDRNQPVLNASVTSGAPEAQGFWSFVLQNSSGQFDQLRITDVSASLHGPPRNLSSTPPLQVGNDVNNGATDAPVTIVTGTAGQATIEPGISATPGDDFVLELWDRDTGQGCPECAGWPQPTSCTLVAQLVDSSTNTSGTLIHLNVETLTYGMSDTPIDGIPTYTIVPPAKPFPPASCSSAISPCLLSVEVPTGVKSFSIKSTESITAPLGASFATPAMPLNCPTPPPIPVSLAPKPPSTGCTPDKHGCCPAAPWCPSSQECLKPTICQINKSNH